MFVHRPSSSSKLTGENAARHWSRRARCLCRLVGGARVPGGQRQLRPLQLQQLGLQCPLVGELR